MSKILENAGEQGNYFETKHGARALKELEANIKAPPMFQKFKEKNTFEDFLKEKHAENYRGLDDNMPDAFDAWLSELEIDTVIKYADEWGKTLV